MGGPAQAGPPGQPSRDQGATPWLARGPAPGGATTKGNVMRVLAVLLPPALGLAVAAVMVNLVLSAVVGAR